MTTLWSPDQSTAQHGADKYHGAVAEGYDAKRDDSPKRKAELRIIETMLSDLPKGAWVLDCPTGTGVLFPLFAPRMMQVWAFDISNEMLNLAYAKAHELNMLKRVRFEMRSVLATGLADKSVDASFMIRLTRWLEPADCSMAIHELARVTRQRIVFTARVANHPHARPLHLFRVDGWKIARNEAGYEEEYRIVAMEPMSDLDYGQTLERISPEFAKEAVAGR